MIYFNTEEEYINYICKDCKFKENIYYNNNICLCDYALDSLDILLQEKNNIDNFIKDLINLLKKYKIKLNQDNEFYINDIIYISLNKKIII